MLNTIKRLPSFLQQVSFWKDFINEMDVELSLLKSELDKRKNQFYPRALNTIEDLRAIHDFFGFKVDVSIYEDIYESDPQQIIDYMKRESEDLIFKVRRKGTREYYEYLFDRVRKPGHMYMLFYDAAEGGSFYRAMNFFDGSYTRVDEEIVTHDFSSGPFLKAEPLRPLLSGMVSQNSLDEGKTLDSSESWTLDDSLYGITVKFTKYIAVEYQASETYTVGSDIFLTTDSYLEYLLRGVLFGKKGTEVPHIGISLTAYTKTDELAFNIPNVNISSSITANWVGNDRSSLPALYKSIEISNGTSTFYEKGITANQIESTDTFDFVNTTFPLNMVNTESLGTGDGVNDNFEGYTVLYPEIIPQTLRVNYTDVGSRPQEVRDDGYGNLYYPEYYTPETIASGQSDLSDFSSGTVNYTTGAVDLITQVNLNFTSEDVTPIAGGVDPEGAVLKLSYYTTYGFYVTEYRIRDTNGGVVFESTFPIITTKKKDYHASVLATIDRRP